ncbi:MAG: hypothetical protein Q8K92_26645 [Leadbetterella sp.]|nr:hypothetical protein [Leadbetterella sp.]
MKISKALKELLQQQTNAELRQIERTIAVIRTIRRQKLVMPEHHAELSEA